MFAMQMVSELRRCWCWMLRTRGSTEPSLFTHHVEHRDQVQTALERGIIFANTNVFELLIGLKFVLFCQLPSQFPSRINLATRFDTTQR